MINFNNILFFFAHPDDEVLSAGGTINLLSKKNKRINILIASKGITYRLNYKKKDKITNLENLYSARRSSWR